MNAKGRGDPRGIDDSDCEAVTGQEVGLVLHDAHMVVGGEGESKTVP